MSYTPFKMKGPSLLKMTSALKNRTRGINAHNTAHAKHDRGQGPDPHADDMPKESDPVKYKKYSPLKEDESKDSEDKNKDKDKGKSKSKGKSKVNVDLGEPTSTVERPTLKSVT